MSTAVATLETQAQSSSSPGEQLGAEITKLCSYIYAAEARLLDLIRMFDEREYWAELGLCSCAHWLNFKCGIGMNAAREKVRVAHALADLPKISMAFEKGELSYSKVRAMTRIADSSNEDYLLMIAHHGTAHHVEKLVSKFRTAQRLQDAEAANEQYHNRELNYHYDHDGCLVIKARLPAEKGALIVKALEMAMDRQFADSEPVGARLARDTDAADVYPKGTWTAVTSDEALPIAARRADALAEIAETYMNNSESSGSTADRYQVVVHVPIGARPARDNSGDAVGARLARDNSHGAVGARLARDTDTDHPHIEHGPHVTAVTSRRIACDCSVVGIKEDENGEPLSIGRRSRSIPPPMRRALGARDGGCRFPGCTNTRFVDGHHIKHWADGGETSLDNLVLLCRHHHHLVHEGGFACEKSADGEIRFKDQRAQPLARSSVLPSIANHRDIQAWLDREFFEADIDSETCTAKWLAGERMDWQMAVSALC